MDVKKTITMLAWDLKIQRLRKIDAVQKASPRKMSFQGLCSALKGVINDSRTISRFPYLLIYKPFGMKMREREKKDKVEAK